MLIQSSESRVLFDEYHKVFGRIDRNNVEQLRLERKAKSIMADMSKMNAWSKRIEKEGKIEKIEKFNNKYIALKMELVKIYGKIEQS